MPPPPSASHEETASSLIPPFNRHGRKPSGPHPELKYNAEGKLRQRAKQTSWFWRLLFLLINYQLI
jgi:hypothetical protein